jgi:hypothetical protein
MLKWLNKYNGRKYGVEKNKQIKFLVIYWIKALDSHKNDLPNYFINENVELKHIIELMTEVVQKGWEINGDKFVEQFFFHFEVINPMVGAFNCASLFYLNALKNNENSIYLDSIWWSLCLTMSDELPNELTKYETLISENSKEQLLNSRENIWG